MIKKALLESTMRHRVSKFGNYETHWREWGESESPLVVLLHGYTQNGQTFQRTAEALSSTYHIVCPDALGRGFSSWIDPSIGRYTLDVIAEQMECLLDELGVEQVRWVGTSMGGIIGLYVASGRFRDRISHLVLNDIGPAFPPTPTRVRETIAERQEQLTFDTFSTINQFFRTSYRENYSASVDDEVWWQSFVDALIHRGDGGKFRAHYDPQILEQFDDVLGQYDMWEAYCAIACRLMVIRGSVSKVLPERLYQEMLDRRHPDRTVVVPSAGHAPLLVADSEISEIVKFFEMNSPSTGAEAATQSVR